MVVAKRAGISRQFRERPAGYSLRAPHNATSVIGDPAEFRAMSATVDYDVALQNDIKNGLLGGEGLFLATLTGPGEVWLQSLPFSRMADEIIKASRDNKGENKGFANPVNEVTGGLNDALGGLFKF